MTQLADQTWTEVDPDALLVLPLGATEQHGPHLPVSTDTDIARELCRRLAARYPAAVVAPALPYGASGEHAGFAGTLSLGQEALELVLVELVRSAMLTYRRVLLVSAHGGNAEPLGRAVRRLREEGHDVRAWGPSWPGDAHAGRTETSVQLALGAPVRPALAPGVTTPIALLLPELRAGGVLAVSPTGVLGDPRGATAEEGELLLARAADQLFAWVSR